MGSHASHRDVSRHRDVCLYPQMPPSLTYLSTGKHGHREETLCQGHRALAHAEPGSREVPAHTPCALPAQAPAHSAPPRPCQLPWATSTLCARRG